MLVAGTQQNLSSLYYLDVYGATYKQALTRENPNFKNNNSI